MTIKKIILRSVSIFIVSAVGIASYFLYQEHIATRNFRNGDQTIVSRRFFEAKCIANLFNHNPLLKDLRISGSSFPKRDAGRWPKAARRAGRDARSGGSARIRQGYSRIRK